MVDFYRPPFLQGFIWGSPSRTIMFLNDDAKMRYHSIGYVFNNTPKIPVLKKGIKFSDFLKTHPLVPKEILERTFSSCHLKIGTKLSPDLFLARI